MFILRKTTEAGLEINFWLGDGYTLVVKSYNPEEFKKLEDDGFTVDKEKCFAVISCHDGKTMLPLFSNQQNRILTSNGTQFDHLD